MVHDELEDFATPVMVQRTYDDEDVYDNERFNNEESGSEDDDMYYNYDGDYFYWSFFVVITEPFIPVFISLELELFFIVNWNFLPKKKTKSELKSMQNRWKIFFKN